MEVPYISPDLAHMLNSGQKSAHILAQCFFLFLKIEL